MDNKKAVDLVNRVAKDRDETAFSEIFDYIAPKINAYYIKAQKIRKLISDDFNEAFKECDLIVTPTTPSSAFEIGDKEDDPIKMYLNDIFTVPASLAGLPGISIPFGKSIEGLPLGVQLLSKHFNEQEIFNASYYLETSKDE